MKQTSVSDLQIRLINACGLVIFRVILPIFILIVLFTICYIIFKIIYTKKKYNFNHFDIFKKREKNNNEKNLIKLYFNNIRGYKKCIELEKNLFIMINELGLYLLLFINETGVLAGNYHDEYLTDVKDNRKIKNPLLKLKKYEEEINDINYGVIVNYGCVLNVKNTKNIKIYEEQFFVNQISSDLGVIKRYSKDEVNKLYNKYCAKKCK